METSAQSGWIVSGHDDATPKRRASPRFLFHIYDARHADRRRAATAEDRMLLSGGRRHGGEVARTGTLNKSGVSAWQSPCGARAKGSRWSRALWSSAL